MRGVSRKCERLGSSKQKMSYKTPMINDGL